MKTFIVWFIQNVIVEKDFKKKKKTTDRALKNLYNEKININLKSLNIRRHMNSHNYVHFIIEKKSQNSFERVVQIFCPFSNPYHKLGNGILYNINNSLFNSISTTHIQSGLLVKSFYPLFKMFYTYTDL